MLKVALSNKKDLEFFHQIEKDICLILVSEIDNNRFMKRNFFNLT